MMRRPRTELGIGASCLFIRRCLIRLCKKNNPSFLLQIDKLIRDKNKIGDVLKITNEIILKENYGLSDREISLAHTIWKKLSSRRLNRGKA